MLTFIRVLRFYFTKAKSPADAAIAVAAALAMLVASLSAATASKIAARFLGKTLFAYKLITASGALSQPVGSAFL